MAFLAPLFFVAMAGLVIPVLLHLTQREKKQVVHFPSLMFVRRIPYQSVRRRKIHNWLLLAIRMTALALIILKSTAEKDGLTSAIASAKPTPAATRYAPALKVAGSILSESTLPRREVILISDFQRVGWRGEEGARLPSGATL